MARKGVTFDQVANAAAAIKARGAEPTISAIRVELGNEGSYTTISQHLAKWKAESADKVDTRDLPPEVENRMMEALMVVWNIATKHAQDDVSAIKQEYLDKEEDLTNELKAANAEIQELEKSLEKSEEIANSTSKDLKTISENYTKLQAKLEATEALYKELAANIKPPADTKKARPNASKPASGNKQAETPRG